jgi:chromosome segregation ATPase
MAKKNSSPVVAVAEKEKTSLETISEAFDACENEFTGILEDYVAGPAMTEEVMIKFQNLKNSIYQHVEALQDKVYLQEEEIKDLEQEVKSRDEDLSDKDKEIKDLEEKVEELEEGEHLTEQGFVMVKVDNLVHRDKLENFIHTEIYPNYLDQQSYVTI